MNREKSVPQWVPGRQVEEVAQGLQGSEGRRLAAAFLPPLRGAPRAGAPQMVRDAFL